MNVEGNIQKRESMPTSNWIQNSNKKHSFDPLSNQGHIHTKNEFIKKQRIRYKDQIQNLKSNTGSKPYIACHF